MEAGIPLILTTEMQQHTFIRNDCLAFAFAPKPHDEAGLIVLVRLAARATNEDDGSVVSVQQGMGRISSRPSLS